MLIRSSNVAFAHNGFWLCDGRAIEKLLPENSSLVGKMRKMLTKCHYFGYILCYYENNCIYIKNNCKNIW